jgi:hypothetical protein
VRKAAMMDKSSSMAEADFVLVLMGAVLRCRAGACQE